MANSDSESDAQTNGLPRRGGIRAAGQRMSIKKRIEFIKTKLENPSVSIRIIAELIGVSCDAATKIWYRYMCNPCPQMIMPVGHGGPRSEQRRLEKLAQEISALPLPLVRRQNKTISRSTHRTWETKGVASVSCQRTLNHVVFLVRQGYTIARAIDYLNDRGEQNMPSRSIIYKYVRKKQNDLLGK